MKTRTVKHGKASKECLPEEAPGYTSANPAEDFARFKEAMRVLTNVPKETVGKTMDTEKQVRKERK